MKYERYLFKKVLSSLDSGKALMIVGPRRVGKTVLLKLLKKSTGREILSLNGEDPATLSLLAGKTLLQYKQLLGTARILMIDEAQKIPNIGSIIKLMLDEIEGLTAVLTGSSAFDLHHQFGEPLTGRKKTFRMYPLTFSEFSTHETALETESLLEEKLLFGGYPEVWQYETREEKSDYLIELSNDYLYRDILTLDQIRNATKLQDILRLLSLQIGKEVSTEELGRNIGLARLTVDKYLDLLEKVFVIFPVTGFSRNLRKEIAKSKRWYFVDNGILNTLLGDFRPLSQRNDVGALWENYLVSERVKRQSETGFIGKNYFWRTYDQQEIDWVEESAGKLDAFEIKWSKQKVKTPTAWRKAYPDATFSVIHQNNYQSFLGT
ncbi:MAG: ATP-binding protein [Candidatus Marinimicrobia bacterium]|nr:ATP-binding protein [Candidatus Neomarinimicrobiota bacterium]MBT4753393.1 ATP-binding protein [Candidatus Neomarinimicrobiota bacterium]